MVYWPLDDYNIAVYLYHNCMQEHWQYTREFITRTVELWNGWIRVSCYYYMYRV